MATPERRIEPESVGDARRGIEEAREWIHTDVDALGARLREEKERLGEAVVRAKEKANPARMLRDQVASHPWRTLGAAALAGLFLGRRRARRRAVRRIRVEYVPMHVHHAVPHRAHGVHRVHRVHRVRGAGAAIAARARSAVARMVRRAVAGALMAELTRRAGRRARGRVAGPRAAPGGPAPSAGPAQQA